MATLIRFSSWWRHQMETISALLVLCAGNSLVTGELPSQRPVTRSFDGFFDLRQNERLSKQTWGWWFETPLRLLWRHGNDDDPCAFQDCPHNAHDSPHTGYHRSMIFPIMYVHNLITFRPIWCQIVAAVTTNIYTIGSHSNNHPHTTQISQGHAAQ